MCKTRIRWHSCHSRARLSEATKCWRLKRGSIRPAAEGGWSRACERPLTHSPAAILVTTEVVAKVRVTSGLLSRGDIFFAVV